jgi:Hom_end-associated Hint
MVQDITVGDIVMGDDSTPRNVLSLGGGTDTLFDINTSTDREVRDIFLFTCSVMSCSAFTKLVQRCSVLPCSALL